MSMGEFLTRRVTFELEHPPLTQVDPEEEPADHHVLVYQELEPELHV